MSANLPVDFQTLAKGARGQNASDYPYSIKATDLMKNFVYAALDADESLLEQTTGTGGYPARKLKIPAVPGSGTYVLGAVDGALTWIATEEC